MRIPTIHNWPTNATEAREIQLRLREKVERRNRLGKIHFIAGADVAFIQPEARSWEHGTGRAIAAVVLYRFPKMEELERVTAEDVLSFPYVPGFLSFREIPVLLKAFALLQRTPDVIFCDGQGVAHPRRFGLACHLGVLLDLPTVGCAKSRLIGSFTEPGTKAGSWSPLFDEEKESIRAARQNSHGRAETIGAVLRTASAIRPIFVSQGHRVTLRSAIRLTLAVCDGRRIPRPTRDADRLAATAKRTRLEIA